MDAFFGDDVGRGPPLSADEEVRLAQSVKRGDRAAFDRLCVENIRLVITIAKDYRHRGVDMPDLVGAGCLGLMEAAARYDPDRGVRFVAYAHYWIRQSIRSEIGNMATTVRVPIHTRRLSRRVSCAADPTPLLAPLTAERKEMVEHALVAARTVALDREVADDAADDGPDPCQVAQLHEQEERDAARLRAALDRLKPTARMVVERTLGLYGREITSMSQLAREFGLTREAVRMRQKNALRLLRENDT